VTAYNLADRLVARTHVPADPLYAAEQVRRLRERIEAMTRWTLEEELTRLFVSTASPRNRDIVVGYYGWRDGRRHTLAEIGDRYGMTRERTRQICAKSVKRRDPGRILAPVLDRVLEFLAERLPRPASLLERDMQRAGLTAVGLSLKNVTVAAKLLGRTVPFRVLAVGKGCLVASPSQSAIIADTLEAAKKAVFYHGLATVGQIVDAVSADPAKSADPAGPSAEEVRPIVLETLPLMDGFAWLDQESGWFRLSTNAKHGVPKAVEKILAVALRVRLPELVKALGRNRRSHNPLPPVDVLVEFCRQMPGVRVDDPWIVADPPRPLDQVLSGVEARLAAIFQQHGPLIERSALEDLCVADGMNRFSFHAFLASSPIITQHGHSVYGLLGTEASPEAVESLMAQHRAERTQARVLDAHGRTADGRIWLSYRLSKAASTYAVITVPAELKDIVSGKFDLVTADGRQVGVLSANDGRAWGLGSLLRHHQARRNDRLVITLDLTHRTAAIAIQSCTKSPSPTP
jgi:hypothetical protein